MPNHRGVVFELRQGGWATIVVGLLTPVILLLSNWDSVVATVQGWWNNALIQLMVFVFSWGIPWAVLLITIVPAFNRLARYIDQRAAADRARAVREEALHIAVASLIESHPNRRQYVVVAYKALESIPEAHDMKAEVEAALDLLERRGR